MNKTTKLIRNNDVITADMNGSAVTMDMKTGKYYNMGEVGTDIWKKLETETTLESLVSELAAEYGITYDSCENDTKTFVNELIEKGLVSVIE